MSLSSGSYMVLQATLVWLTGNCYCCVSFTLVTIVIFWSVKSKWCLSRQWKLRFLRMFTFCWINYRPCKHHGTAPSLAKIPLFKCFRASCILKQVKRAHLHFCCKVLPIAVPNRMSPWLSLWKDLRESKGSSS